MRTTPDQIEAALRAKAPAAWVEALDQRQAEDAANRRGRGGRPRAADPKGERVTVRLTAAERGALDELAGPGGIGEYLRTLGFRRRSRLPRQVPPVNAEAWVALAPVLSNLNQLAHHANEGRIPADVLPVLEDVRRQVVALRASLLGRESDDVPGASEE